MSAYTFNQYFLAAFFSVVALFYTVFILARARRYGGRFIHAGQRGTCHWWNHMIFRVFRVAIWGACVARLFFADTVDTVLGVVATPAWVLWLGDVLLIAGFAGAAMSSMYLGQEWRSGVDAGQRSLVTRGPFARSRNPIFLGAMTAQLGFLLALPSVFSLICLGLSWWTIARQVRIEERDWAQKAPESYQRYCSTVPRWL